MKILRYFEMQCKSIRHSRALAKIDILWDSLRPIYCQQLNYFGREGLLRNMNGTHLIKLSPEFSQISENYEPEVWKALFLELKSSDTFVDVGAFIGLYAIAIGLQFQQMGGIGRVIAFEPEPSNAAALIKNLKVNGLQGTVTVFEKAVSEHCGSARFQSNRSSQSRLSATSDEQGGMVPVTTLDVEFLQQKVDVLKIDVEGFEEFVLRGGRNLLSDSKRAPRTIFIEVHPYAWAELGVTDDSLLSFLNEMKYEVFDLKGAPVKTIDAYGEVIARKRV